MRTCRNAALDLGIEVKMGGKGRSMHIVECTCLYRRLEIH